MLNDVVFAIDEVISRLTKRFDRLPTEDEVFDFILGDGDAREAIWNKEVNNNG